MSMVSLKSFNKLLDDRIQKELKKSITIDRNHDVPYVAGYSEDGKTIYIDRHFNHILNGINVEPYVIFHERIEKALLHIFNMHYQEAHALATYAEKQKVGSLWKKYNLFVMNQYKHIHVEKLKNVPYNLDLTPYEDEKDYKILDALRKKYLHSKS